MRGSNNPTETKDENPSNHEGNKSQNSDDVMVMNGAGQNSSSALGGLDRPSANTSPVLGNRSDASILDFDDDDWSQDPFTATKESDVFAPFAAEVQEGNTTGNMAAAAPTHDALPPLFPPAGVLVPTIAVPAQPQLDGDTSRKRSAPEPAPAVSNSAPTTSPSSTKSVFSRRKKKPKGMPKRPLSAYNLYFQAERGRILEEQAKLGEAAPKIGFEGLGKIIGKQWKTLSNADKREYETLAEKDGERYRKEMDAYNDLKSKLLEEEVSRPLSTNPQFAAVASIEMSHSAPPILQTAPAAPAVSAHGGVYGYAAMPQGMHFAAPVQGNAHVAKSSLGQTSAGPSMYARDRASSVDGAPAPSPSAALSYDGRGTPSHHHQSPAQTPRPTASVGQHPPPSLQRYPLPNSGMPQHGNMPNSFPLPPDMEIVLSDSNGVDRKYKVHYTCYAMTREAAHQYLEALTAGSRSSGNTSANYGGNAPAPASVASASSHLPTPPSAPHPAQGQPQAPPQPMGGPLHHYGAAWGR